MNTQVPEHQSVERPNPFQSIINDTPHSQPTKSPHRHEKPIKNLRIPQPPVSILTLTHLQTFMSTYFDHHQQQRSTRLIDMPSFNFEFKMPLLNAEQFTDTDGSLTPMAEITNDLNDIQPNVINKQSYLHYVPLLHLSYVIMDIAMILEGKEQVYVDTFKIAINQWIPQTFNPLTKTHSNAFTPDSLVGLHNEADDKYAHLITKATNKHHTAL